MAPINLEDEVKPLLVDHQPQRRSSYGGLNGSINSSQGKTKFHQVGDNLLENNVLSLFLTTEEVSREFQKHKKLIPKKID